MESLNNILNVEGGLYVIPYEWAASAMATSIEDEGVVGEMTLPKLYGTVINLSYSSVAVDERYHNFFYGSSNTTNLHLITAGKLADVKFDQYNNGDVIVVYISNIAEVLG